MPLRRILFRETCVFRLAGDQHCQICLALIQQTHANSDRPTLNRSRGNPRKSDTARFPGPVQGRPFAQFACNFPCFTGDSVFYCLHCFCVGRGGGWPGWQGLRPQVLLRLNASHDVAKVRINGLYPFTQYTVVCTGTAATQRCRGCDRECQSS